VNGVVLPVELGTLIGAYIADGRYSSLTGYEENLDRLRSPQWAAGECANVSWQFTAFAASKGVAVKPYDSDPDSLGYHDRALRGASRHTVVRWHHRETGRRYLVDFTAAQYGYTDAFPLVSVRQDSGDWLLAA
jgi:hypothetical protein